MCDQPNLQIGNATASLNCNKFSTFCPVLRCKVVCHMSLPTYNFLIKLLESTVWKSSPTFKVFLNSPSNDVQPGIPNSRSIYNAYFQGFQKARNAKQVLNKRKQTEVTGCVSKLFLCSFSNKLASIPAKSKKNLDRKMGILKVLSCAEAFIIIVGKPFICKRFESCHKKRIILNSVANGKQ